jgi:hypothetical protein
LSLITKNTLRGNLPLQGSINGWVNFEEQFISNFTSVYKKPNCPQQLASYRQGDYDTDCDYLTRWCTMRNSCEGVVETQAITWFAQGCQHGTMLWQRLQREMPATLAETIKIADSYALCDPTQPLLQVTNAEITKMLGRVHLGSSFSMTTRTKEEITG